MENTIKNSNNKKIFIALACDYGNSGDIAITLAQRKYIESIYNDNTIIEIPMINFFNYIEYMNSIIENDDIITIIGGGNMGNIYQSFEDKRRYIIENYPNNKIISFPQSIDFEENKNGKDELAKTIEIYGKHPDLTIFARENKSYQFMKDNFKNNIKLVPDMVMYLSNKTKVNIKKDNKKFLLCFRNDSEKITSKDINQKFKSIIPKKYVNIKEFDNLFRGIKFKPEEKSSIFNSVISEFYSSDIVATDRLHGLIFSLITKTPCIAFDNLNNKISSTYYTWLKDIPFIKFLDKYDDEEVLKCIDEFSKLNLDSINLNFDEKFEPLYKELNK